MSLAKNEEENMSKSHVKEKRLQCPQVLRAAHEKHCYWWFFLHLYCTFQNTSDGGDYHICSCLLSVYLGYSMVHTHGCKSNRKVWNKVRDQTRFIPWFRTSVPYLLDWRIRTIPLFHTCVEHVYFAYFCTRIHERTHMFSSVTMLLLFHPKFGCMGGMPHVHAKDGYV